MNKLHFFAFSEQLSSVPELAALNLGPLFKSSLPIELTESETEFVVRCIKHTFNNHIVLQVSYFIISIYAYYQWKFNYCNSIM